MNGKGLSESNKILTGLQYKQILPLQRTMLTLIP